jgi:hypothetical protein
MSSGTHLKLCLINALLNTFTHLKGEEVRKEEGGRGRGGGGGGGGGEMCGVMRDDTIITVET